MRKFKFDIDDWTGGNTIGKSMGDAVGGSLTKYSFVIYTSEINTITFSVRNLSEIYIDWGDGTNDTIEKNDVGYSRFHFTHDYADGELIERKISVLIKDNNGKTAYISYIRRNPEDAHITNYEILHGIDGVVHENFTYINTYDPKHKAMNVSVSNFINTIMTNSIVIGNCITNLDISDSVKEIKGGAINCNEIIYNIKLPQKCKLEQHSLYSLKGNPLKPTQVRIPDCGKIPKYLCSNSKYINFIIPSNINTIGERCFSDCLFNRDYKISSNVKMIERCAYAYTSFEGDLVIPGNVKEIKDGAFGCVDTNSIIIEEGVERIGKNVFRFTKFKSGEIVLPDSLLFLDESAFNNNKYLTSIKFGKGLKVIKPFTFSGTPLIGKVIIPENIERIEYNAFAKCTRLKEIHIPYHTKLASDGIFDAGDKIKIIRY